MFRQTRRRFATIFCAATATLCLLQATFPSVAQAQQRPASERKPIPAFPGAEGAGAFTRGGRGGRVIEVTNLQNNGEGSFRAAVEAGGPRTVVFRVSGVITLESPVAINNPFLTIAGQTAPGDGICIRGNTVSINAPEVIIRHLRFRRGNLDSRDDNLNAVHSPGNIIIDHCTFSWGSDENVSFYRYMKPDPAAPGKYLKRPIENVTIQWCISSEALNKNNHAFGATWGGKNVSFHHNLFASNTARNPSIGWGDHVDFRNNVLFNWRHRTIDGGDSTSHLNVVANYYKAGPATLPGQLQYRICRPEIFRDFNESGDSKPGQWHVADNFVYGHPEITADNWSGGVQLAPDASISQNPDSPAPSADKRVRDAIEAGRKSQPAPFAPITQQTAEAAYELVLAQAGATLPRRDAVDTRITNEVRTGRPAFGPASATDAKVRTGIIDDIADAGGWPVYQSTPAPLDSDHDGMPDAWERLYGFNPNDPADSIADADRDGYTNLEEYLNGVNPRKNPPLARRPASAAGTTVAPDNTPADFAVLKSNADLARKVAYFNAAESEPVINLVPNADSLAWLETNIPRFECPDADVTEIYYFRWWALRKHLRRDTASNRLVFTEFILKGPISSSLGLQLSELRWLRDQTAPDEYVQYWLHGNADKPQAHLYKYSGWLSHALLNRAYVTGNTDGLVSMLDDLIADYAKWETDKKLSSGLYWQFDVWDAMEESISGSRTEKNIRPTINSYMFGNARALAAIARMAKRFDLAAEFDEKSAALKQLTLDSLWDADAKFFKVRLAKTDTLSDARESIGFIPWYFSMPDIERGYEDAWAQINDPAGFHAPFGITTAERRHPQFRSHSIGTCEWDGALWPYATSQTLAALANVVRDYPQKHVTRADYFDAFITYTRSHRFGERPYIGEYQDEVTGQWLKGNHPRSSWYHHSTYADALIAGVVGLRPRADNRLVLDPLIPADAWAWFCLDGVKYHGHTLTILWDRDGTKYNRGAGFRVFANGNEIATSPTLTRLQAELP